MGGNLNSSDRPTGFTKYIGTKPSHSDGKDWYPTMASASPAAGDRILVVNGYTLTATETWSFRNVNIVFMPNQALTFTAATTRALYITGYSNKIYDMNLELNLAPLDTGIEVAGADNQIYGLLLTTINGSLTLTNAVTLLGARNTAIGECSSTSGAITNKVGTVGTGCLASISGLIKVNDISATGTIAGATVTGAVYGA